MQPRHRLRDLSALLITELRARIERRELTTTCLAARTLFSQPHVWHLLNGKRRLTIETADALMLAAGLSIEDLMRPHEPPPPPGSAPARTRNAGPRMYVNRAA